MGVRWFTPPFATRASRGPTSYNAPLTTTAGTFAMAKIRIGLAGCGFVSELHMHAYRRVYGVDVEVKAVAARGEHVVDFAKRHRIPVAHRSFRDLIADADIDVVDICTPPNLHASMIVEAMQAGKHVICEKPFAGYFGREGEPAPIGKHVPKALMYKRVLEEMEETCAAIRKTGKLFMYAEDWIYAPAVTKTAEILKATKDKILFMKGEESHSGSHAAHAAQWSMTGGGSLIRMGCHPLSAVLYLKQVEAKARGEVIRVASVTCDVGNVSSCLRPDERAFIKANPIDVEDWGTLTLTFSDGTKATVFSGDMIMGGVRNLIETYTSGGSLFANITPNTHMMSYQTSEEKLAGVYITEKVDRKTGWQYVCLEEEWTRGYQQEIQDFMECVATGRQPLADLALAFDTIKVNYAGYWAAEEGCRVTF
jgi:predicted dehydrogenase